MARVGIRSMGSSNIRISIVVAVSIAGVVGSIAVRGVAVGGVGSIGRGTAIGVGGGADDSLTGGSAHVHLLTMIHAPLAVSRSIGRVPVAISVTISIRRVSITISIRGIAIASTITSITISAIASIAPISAIAAVTSIAAVAAVATVSIPIVTTVSIIGSLNSGKKKTGCQCKLQHLRTAT